MSKDPFKALKDAMNAGKERWTKIEELAEKVKSTTPERPDGQDSNKLLVLLVEHLRPLYSPEDQKLDTESILKALIKPGKKQ